MRLDFTKDTHKRLRLSLTAHGCKEPTRRVISQFERLAHFHLGPWLSCSKLPALHSAAQAGTILEFAGHVCDELNTLHRVTQRRMRRELTAGDEEMSLTDYSIAVNDVCMFSFYTLERSIALAVEATGGVDLALRNLCEAVIGEWKRLTGSELPEVSDGYGHSRYPWEQVRQLQLHPLWIVLDALGVTMSATGMRSLMAHFGIPAAGTTGEVG